MDSNEQALIDFALTWQPFGGPPAEEIFTTFGISKPEFCYRVHRILVARGTTGDEPFRRHARAVLRAYMAVPHTCPRTAGDDTRHRNRGSASRDGDGELTRNSPTDQQE